ncbi:hypothetical protein NMY22_g17170 [Coprinellus aureogranulatus]|nr:hypothetical protein NMY22_g17170 [Coprinellus aureogranulatus]
MLIQTSLRPLATPTARSTGPLPYSDKASVGALTVNNVQGNMIIRDPEQLRYIEAQLQTLLRNLPPVVGHGSSNSLILTDALGETLTLPWSLVPTYDASEFVVLADTLRLTPILMVPMMVRSTYRATPTLQPERLLMSMILLRRWWSLTLDMTPVCPKCGKTLLETYEDQGWQVWHVGSPLTAMKFLLTHVTSRRCNTRFIPPCRDMIIEHFEKTDNWEDEGSEIAHFRHVRVAEVMMMVGSLSTVERSQGHNFIQNIPHTALALQYQGSSLLRLPKLRLPDGTLAQLLSLPPPPSRR